MQVQQIMTANPDVIPPTMMVCDAARRMRADGVGALPVGENDRLIGMVTDRDIVMRAVADDRAAGSTAVREVMSEGIYYCFDDEDVDRAASIMAEHQVRRLPVLNRDKRLIGIVALGDLARHHLDAERTALEGVSEPSSAPRR